MNHIGKKVGLLTVISSSGGGSKGQNLVCRCDCGSVIEINSAPLLSKDRIHPASCGCLFTGKDHTGKKYGNWEVLGLSHYKEREGEGRQAMWKCRCKCGVEKEREIQNLEHGRSSSCARCAAMDRVNDGTHHLLARARWVDAFGEIKSISGWMRDDRCVVGLTTLQGRINSGWEPEEAISLPAGGIRNKGKK